MSLIKEIAQYIREGETESERLGLEVEHFVVNDEGRQIGFEEVSALILAVSTLLGAKTHYMDGYPVGYATEKYSVSLEPSCQFEVSIIPYAEISKIAEVYNEFYILWNTIFEARGYHFETKGNLPLVENGDITPDEIPLSPKKRYRYMDRHFQNSGKYGKYMMRASASVQVSVDYRSEEDLVKKIRVLEKISPVLMILMESKSNDDSTPLGEGSDPHLLRIQEWDDLDPERTGYLPGSLEEGYGYEDMARLVYQTPLILLTDEGETVNVGRLSARDLLEHEVIYEEDLEEDHKNRLFEHFISMGFFHLRIKKYIEIRVADSNSIEKALGYTALIKGLIYSPKNMESIEEELSDIDRLEKIQAAVKAIERDGREAIIYGGRKAGEWGEWFKELAADALSEKEREYLKNV